MFSKGTKVHLIGIKGVGMTALAQILKQRGLEVSGSDTKDKFFTDKVLKSSGIKPKVFSEKNITKNIDVVISSGAYYFSGRAMGDNLEVKEVLKRGIKILTYPQAVGELSKEYKTIAVAGSHGKSTITAMLGWAAQRIGKDPTVIAGTRINAWKANARVGKSNLLILEADEYREAFLNYSPNVLIITSIDYDHPDYYKTPALYYRAFKKMVDRVEKGGVVIGFGDDVEVANLLSYAKGKKLKTVKYGFSKRSDLVLENEGVFHDKHIRQAQCKQLFHGLFNKGKKLRGVLKFPGKHQIANAGAVLATAKSLKWPVYRTLDALKEFSGTARRFEVLRKYKNGAIVIDDYAHHPTAIKKTLEAARSLYPKKKIIAIFQPHMFSRTEALLEDFATAFSDADEVGIMEIYASAREKSGKVSGRTLTAHAKEHHRFVNYLKNSAEAKKFLNLATKKDAAVLLMGAGDVYKLTA
ncbi:MAG: UDP-N-acetylmuramate--L-alanine ligase [Candidatus Harrisonbacteria bacterium CG10_big_fil_rev_8_21_14_0_10_44_23]|uniref:UDP-N-acetylmuramate--L-alanine ligase n=1 Tax=Candidatus Harrisonbacteria bacterium CG10_big_fil_rev_8_21_14_0_10_44_23 TaxID=1974585 RepID=A0A2H0UQS9_9BACT|nr:MAG: UDP-N-acetylmuramate--L-alanine ligase [Candidatus Harrisonbacteria bacterium CG10_big_fil_rev_8_21_14_0_10_44_23]